MGEACLVCKQKKYPLVRSRISQYICELLYTKSSILKTWNSKYCKTLSSSQVLGYSWFQTFAMFWMLCSFFWWFPSIWILCADVSEHSVCSIFISGVIRKNNRDDIAWVFIQVKFWLKNSLSQSDGGWTGKGRVWVEEQAVEGSDLKRRPVIRTCGKNCPVSERGRGAMGW